MQLVAQVGNVPCDELEWGEPRKERSSTVAGTDADPANLGTAYLRLLNAYVRQLPDGHPLVCSFSCPRGTRFITPLGRFAIYALSRSVQLCWKCRA